MNSPSDADGAPATGGAPSRDAHWRADIASLVFGVPEHSAICAVHRGAFRTLLGTDPTPDACLGYFCQFEEAFRAAARAKILRKRIPVATNLHLTSRDIARKLLEAEQIERGERP
ncbi:hypothetical protein [Bradyrhizobium septentrionale]|uniref:DUF1488 domain-containing protein n=1 Tax=Bradyrhizobium septentrionale TaxID=1404411 RepID=A0ABZ2NRI1_9BRAD|nr:hypothetical protein [Bradyrhizobium septentrionale]UGY13250.1 hypothetical protein HAP48_0032310 [Bradyrhizobium septentrionale]UGY21884.1 hypothetical protein HU675_0028200 [Bradyrhizobium septentrionale]